MEAAIKRLQLKFSRPGLLKALETIQKRHPFHPDYHCISLTHSLKARTPEERAHDGAGPIFDRDARKFLRDPLEFTIFNREFSDLYFHEVYQKVCAWSPLRIGRVRLFLRKPRSCMHMHTDDSPRYHIAITTNEDSYFFFKREGAFHIPADGRLYHCETTKLHTFWNAGDSPRVHLVFDTIEWRFLQKKKPALARAGL